MPDFTPNQWLILGLVLLLGIVIGMALRGGGKWKARYREEAELRRQDVKRLEADNAALRKDVAGRDTVRPSEVRDDARLREEERLREERLRAEEGRRPA